MCLKYSEDKKVENRIADIQIMTKKQWHRDISRTLSSIYDEAF